MRQSSHNPSLLRTSIKRDILGDEKKERPLEKKGRPLDKNRDAPWGRLYVSFIVSTT